MHKFHFRPGKSALFALILGLGAMLVLWFWWAEDKGFLTLLVGLLMAAGSGKLASDAMSDTPALAFDREVLRVRKTWGGVTEVPWREVQHIGVDVMTLRYWGIIPIARQETLVVRCDGGLFGARRLRLALKMVALPPGGTARLLDMLYRAHVEAVGETGVAMAGAGEHGWGVNSVPTLAPRREETDQAGFDADAALARYLARKEAGLAGSGGADGSPAAPPIPARPVFGRKTQAG